MIEKQVISKNELGGILANRMARIGYGPESKKIQGKEINDGIVLQQRISVPYDTFIQSLVFDDCIFNQQVDLGDYEQAGAVRFYNCIFNNIVKIQLSNSSLSRDCIFNSDLIIQLKQGSVAEISDYNVKGKLQVYGPTGFGTSQQKLFLKDINRNQEIKDQKVEIGGEFGDIIVEGVFGNIMEFRNDTTVHREFAVERTHISSLIIGRLVLNTEMAVASCKIQNLQIGNTIGARRGLKISDSFIEKIELQMNVLLRLSILESSINNLMLVDVNTDDSILSIEKTTISNLRFERMFNKGLITIKELNIPANGIVSFKSSNLGKADFIYCDFSKATLEFENSKITESFFSETEFPKKVLVNGRRNYGQAQLAFGQLATAFQKQGDSIRALEYNSRELEAHYKNIRLFSSHFFQKINLWLNAISNNFGRNWFLGIVFSFGIGLLFFCLLLISTDKYGWGFPHFDFKLMPAYLKFMNPLRFFELEALFNNTPQEGVIKLGGRSYLADFFGRVFVAYGYYQTIQAFRRFGRK